jgi:hypothetical protein
VQAASKHFDHHPDFLGRAHALLVESRLDGARGLGILLRKPGPPEATASSSAISAQVQPIGAPVS